MRVVAVHEKVAERVACAFLAAASREVERALPVVARVEVVDLDGALHHAVVARHRGKDVQLHARVARVHLLLVERTVEEHLVAAHLHRARRDVAYGAERRIVRRREDAFHFDGIARLDYRDRVDRQRFVLRLDVDASPLAAAEPWRGELGALASVRHERVAECGKISANDPAARIRLARLELAVAAMRRLGEADRELRPPAA